MTECTWPEQNAVDAWLEKHGIVVPFAVSMELKKAVTEYRIKVQNESTPTAPAAPSVDARDAARYRWLVKNCFDWATPGDGDSFDHIELHFEHPLLGRDDATVGEAIDSEMAVGAAAEDYPTEDARAALARSDAGVEAGVAAASEDDLLLVPRGLLGAACSAIDKKRDAPNLLAKLRTITLGDAFDSQDPLFEQWLKTYVSFSLDDPVTVMRDAWGASAALSTTHPASEPKALTEEQIDTLRLAIGYIGSSDRADRQEHIARIRALLEAAK